MDHMQKWPDIVLKLTTFDPSKEKPRLVWRRDARLSIDIEKKVGRGSVIVIDEVKFGRVI